MGGRVRMIDLHLHLAGSLSAETVLCLAERQNYPLPANNARNLKSYISAGRKCTSMEQCLTCAELPFALLQTEDALRYATYDIIKRLDASKMRYAELRFAPQLHTDAGLTQSMACAAVIDGLNEALGECKYMLGAQIILCCMRSDSNEDENLQTVRLAKEFLGKGVAALDLAGEGSAYCSHSFERIFELAAELDVPFVIHADTTAGVKKAIDMGVRRVGNGLRICDSEELLELVTDKGIALEMCPSGDLQTGAIAKIKQYPLRPLLKRGAIVTVNTDNMTVHDTSIKREYTVLKNSISLTAEEEKMLLLNAVYASFLDEDKKQRLSQIIYEQWLYG